MIESTYGDREHGDVQAEIDEMAAAITRTLKRGGTVVIPAFAVDRTEVLLDCPAHACRTSSASRWHRSSVDSPMALAAMRVYVRAIRDADPEISTAIDRRGP